MTCPHCGNDTNRYTDPQGTVRCTLCFNHADGSPAPIIGREQDLNAPIEIVHVFAPREPIHYGR